MALSARKKDVALDIKDDIPNVIVRNHQWPKALPDAINQIVITYFDPSIEEVKELDKHFKQLKNETMAPFRNAIESKIVPLLNKPTLAQIYKSKPTKSKWNFVVSNAEKLLDSLLEQMGRLPVDQQLEFLCTVYDGSWKKEEKVHFNQVKDSIKTLYESFDDAKQIGVFKAHIEQVIFEKLNNFISATIAYPYQASQADRVSMNDNKNQEVKVVESVEQLFQQEQSRINLITRRGHGFWRSYVLLVCAAIIFLGIGSLTDESYSKPFVWLGGALFGFGLLFFTGTYVYGCLQRFHQSQVTILQTARHRLFQVQEQQANQGDNNLTESLLTPEQQAEYKKEEDEESNLRPGSPSTKR